MTIKIKHIILVFLGLLSAVIFTGYIIGRQAQDNALQTLLASQNKEIIEYRNMVRMAEERIDSLEAVIEIKDVDIRQKDLRLVIIKYVSDVQAKEIVRLRENVLWLKDSVYNTIPVIEIFSSINLDE